jgi:uncharacterized protein YndB with AHSA1/START domain
MFNRIVKRRQSIVELENMPKISQEVTFSVPPAVVYEALTNSATHSKLTAAPAEIDAKVGGAWSAYGGKISGRNIELVPGVRIVQTWRAGNWPEGTHTLVRFELSPEGQGTKLTLDHDAVTEEQAPHLAAGWEKMYWEPMRKFFSA